MRALGRMARCWAGWRVGQEEQRSCGKHHLLTTAASLVLAAAGTPIEALYRKLQVQYNTIIPNLPGSVAVV